MKFDILDHRIILQTPFRAVAKPDKLTTGMTNRTQDGWYIPFFDYDDVQDDVVFDDMAFLQKNWGIGPAIVCKSSESETAVGKKVGNYHAIAFTKWTLPELVEMLKLTQCDDHFKRAGTLYQQRCWVLRVFGKEWISDSMEVKPAPVPCAYMDSEPRREMSKPHWDFITTLYGVDVPVKGFYKTFDTCTGMTMINYPTR